MKKSEVEMVPATDKQNRKVKSYLQNNNFRAYNQWREENPSILPNLSGQNFADLECEDANFSGIDLTGVYNIQLASGLGKANLVGATLDNEQLIDLLKRADTRAFNKYRKKNPDAVIDLSGMDAEGKDLSHGNFHDLDLTNVIGLEYAVGLGDQTDWHGATLSDKQLQGLLKSQPKAFNKFCKHNPKAEISLDGFDAEGVDLHKVHLEGLDLRGVRNLEQAKNIAEAHLTGAQIAPAQAESLEKQGVVLEGTGMVVAEREVASVPVEVEQAAQVAVAPEVASVEKQASALSDAVRLYADRVQRLKNALENGTAEQFGIVKAGNVGMRLPLAGADVAEVNLSGFDFRGDDLSGIKNLAHAKNLHAANLENATVSHQQMRDMLESGKNESFNACRAQKANATPDLAGLDADKLMFEHADLRGLDLSGVLHLEKLKIAPEAWRLQGATLSEDQLATLAEAGRQDILAAYEKCNAPITTVEAGGKVAGKVAQKETQTITHA